MNEIASVADVDTARLPFHTGLVTPKILVVEDDPSHAAAVATFLTQRGFVVIQSTDSVNALILAEKNAPDLLILDYQLPGGNGLDVYDRLRLQQGNINLPAIFISGFLDYVRGTVQDGPSVRFFSKPADLAHVLAAVHELLKLPPPPRSASGRNR